MVISLSASLPRPRLNADSAFRAIRACGPNASSDQGSSWLYRCDEHEGKLEWSEVAKCSDEVSPPALMLSQLFLLSVPRSWLMWMLFWDRTIVQYKSGKCRVWSDPNAEGWPDEQQGCIELLDSGMYDFKVVMG
jgi:hypothetical protein